MPEKEPEKGGGGPKEDGAAEGAIANKGGEFLSS